MRFIFRYSVLFGILFLLAVVSMGIGRYPVPFKTVIDILCSYILPIDPYWSDTQRLVVIELRLPRILAAIIAGGALAMAGATLQGIFRNPLVDSHIIGISGGAAFGGALALFLMLPGLGVVTLSFGAGLVALILVFALSRVGRFKSLTALVLAGLIIGSFFSALVSLVVFISDPEIEMPGIVYWLMGSFARVDGSKLLLLVTPVLSAGCPLFLMRWRINLLSLEEADAAGLGIKVQFTRWCFLVLIAIMVGAQTAVSGGIGWVGLVIPHMARTITGPDHRTLLPTSALMGGAFTLAMDDLARAFTAQELPVGLLSALIGTPVFAYLYWRHQDEWSKGA